MYPSVQLAQSPLFQYRPETLPVDARVRLTYQRAQLVGRLHGLTPEDVLTLSPKLFALHTDPIVGRDGSIATLLTLQYNCCAGTLAMFSEGRPDLKKVLQRVLNYDVSGQFCLTEVGHGLDAFHIETTATLMPNGDFELNTPNGNAAKFMPPTAPLGIPCLAVVFARTIVKGEDHGVKPFLVYLHDGETMQPGVVSKLLPQRGGSRPVNHSLTYFHRVRLPFSALLCGLEKPKDARAAFFHNISRIAVGSIAIASLGVPMLQVSTYVAARYSLRRTTLAAGNQPQSILAFRTQKTPIMTAIAQCFVMSAFHQASTTLFRDASIPWVVRHALAAIFKVTICQHTLATTLTLGDRCGAQGLFETNQITGIFADMRGASIAEGDLLALSIRFASELLLGRYSIPGPTKPDSPLARHELGLYDELRGHLATMSGHRGSAFDRLILPESMNFIQAIGQRMAYEAAIAQNVDSALIDLYVASCIKLDSAWYVDKAALSRYDQREMENKAVDAVFERMEEFLEKMGVKEYVTAPILSDEAWQQYVDGLKTFGGERDDNLLDDSVAVRAMPSIPAEFEETSTVMFRARL